MWRIPTLSSPEQQRIYTDIGGHPRALKYLDVLLREGQGRYTDVTERLETILLRRGIKDGDSWLRGPFSFDRALAEGITLAIEDALVLELIDLLDSETRGILSSASVYRIPVNRVGLAWPVSAKREYIEVPTRHGQQVLEPDEFLKKAPPDNRSGAKTDLSAPITEPEGIGEAIMDLANLGLLAVSKSDDDVAFYMVHRWIAVTLGRSTFMPSAHLRVAHSAAASHWWWRVQEIPQSRQQDIPELLEARYHYHAAGHVEAALLSTELACNQLHVWGLWNWEENLYREALAWLPAGDADSAVVLYQLGRIAELRGDYDQALDHQQQALTIAQELGDRASTARIMDQIGTIAQHRGNYDQALDYIRHALSTFQELGDRAGVAQSLHQLGRLAELRGDYDQALDHQQQALTIAQELGDRASTARIMDQIGTIAQHRGNYDQALDYIRHALSTFQELGDRAGVAQSLHQLGRLAELRGDYDQALDHQQQALTIAQELGDRASTARIMDRIGTIAQHRGNYDQALDYIRHALSTFQELGDRAGVVQSLHQLGRLAELRGDYDQALDHQQQALTIAQELGDRAGAARCHELLGTLLAETGWATEAIGHSVLALEIYVDLKSPEVDEALYSLHRQRELVGEEQFRDTLSKHLDSKSVIRTIEMLNDYEGQGIKRRHRQAPSASRTRVESSGEAHTVYLTMASTEADGGWTSVPRRRFLRESLRSTDSVFISQQLILAALPKKRILEAPPLVSMELASPSQLRSVAVFSDLQRGRQEPR